MIELKPIASNDECDAESQRERVIREVVAGLYDGRFQPGQRLIEAQLTVRCGVSRGSVREAFNSLAAMGILELTQQRGAQVKVLSLREAIDMLEVFEALDVLAARRAAQRIGRPGARALLSDALDRLMAFDASANTIDHDAARDHFYAILTRIGGNLELKRMLQGVRGHLFRIQFRTILRAADKRRHSDYRRIAESVLTGKPSAAEAAVRAHVRRAIDALEKFSDMGPTGDQEL